MYNAVSEITPCPTYEPHVKRRRENVYLQITPGEEGFFGLGSPYVNGDPSGVPGNVQASGKCALYDSLECMLLLAAPPSPSIVCSPVLNRKGLDKSDWKLSLEYV